MIEDPRKSHPIPEPEAKIKNLADEAMPLIVTGYQVSEWHPQPDGKGKPEKVALILRLGGQLDGATVVMMIGSRLELNRLIQILERHRDNVWPIK